MDFETIKNLVKDEYSGRAYHNWDHIQGMLDFCSSVDSFILNIAILFHDVVYDPTAKDNEEQSISFMFSKLATHIPIFKLVLVADLIAHTKYHKLYPQAIGYPKSIDEHQDKLCAWIIDADLWGFVIDPVANAAKIRQEFSMYSQEAYLKGRFDFLSKFVARDPFFYVPEHESVYGNLARKNIGLEMLQIDKELREKFEVPVGIAELAEARKLAGVD